MLPFENAASWTPTQRRATLADVPALQRLIAESVRQATLPGERLYRSCGYVRGEPAAYPLGGGLTITFVPMRRVIQPRVWRREQRW
jgi:hypothetical protein